MHHMRKLLLALTTLAMTAAVFASLSGSAFAASAQSSTQAATIGANDRITEPASVALGVGLPIYFVKSEAWRPPGFSTTGLQAVQAAKTDSKMLAIHAREHPLQYSVNLWLGRDWVLYFYYRHNLAAEVDVSKTGHVVGVWTGPEAAAPYTRGDFATPFGVWWVVIPFSLLFLVPFLNPRRLLQLRHLDALAVLSFLVSYLLFDHAKLIPAVWTVYPPLVYLLMRMLWIGRMRLRGGSAPARRRRAPAAGLASFLTVPVLSVGLALLVVARIVLGLTDPKVVDVGYASVIGAHQIAAGHSLYFTSTAHGDTYGPIAYLAYLPFELLFPWHGAWDYLPSAHAASLCFDLVTVLGLVLLGRRLRRGREGLRLGLALGWAWCACPFTLLALMMHTNDGLIAMLSVLSLLAFTSPLTRGVLLGLAAAAKFAPGALLGLYASGRHAPSRRRGLRGMLECVIAFVVVAAVSIGLFLPSGGLSEFYKQTIEFQLTRSDVFSPWALYSSLVPIKVAIEVGAVLLCGLVAFYPRRRSLGQAAALAGAITIAVQLPAVHWFYYYIVWFVPFVAVALLAGEPDPEPVEVEAPAVEDLQEPMPERHLVPA
jgi:hypothetical protein